MRKDAVATVQPAVRPPSEGIQGFMGVLVGPTIEQNFWRTGWLRFIAVLNRDEHQVRCSADPDTAKTDFQTAHKVQPFHENGPPIKFAVAIGIFENEDAIF